MRKNKPKNENIEDQDKAGQEEQLKNLPREIQLAINDLEISEPQKEKVAKAFLAVSTRVMSTSYSGPLPPPEVLNGYNESVKDGAERIVKMAENQANHRISIESYSIKEELKQSSRGQLFGFVLGFLGLGLATLLAILGHDTIAGIFGATTIVGLVTVFVVGTRSSNNRGNSD